MKEYNTKFWLYRQVVLALFCSLFFQISVAQTATEYPPDFFKHIRAQLNSKPKIDLRTDGRFSFVNTGAAKVFGLKVGADFNEVFKVGLGANIIFDGGTKVFPSASALDIADTGRFAMAYLAPYVEYVFYKKNHWTLSIPLQAGIGVASYSNILNGDAITETGFIIYEPNMMAEYGFLRYFGVGAGVGYRLVGKFNSDFPEQLSSAIYAFKFKVYLGEMFKDFVKGT